MAPERKLPVQFLGLHVLLEGDADAGALIGQIPELAAAGVNLLIAQVDYHFEYDSHPELRSHDLVTKAAAKQLAGTCREYGIRLIPEFMSLGHQSWASETFLLLTKYPEFDETPGHYPLNWGIYCRSWCPSNPEVNKIIFSLYDELIDVFEADALHVGMDEVIIIASEYCTRCRGRDPAVLFAKAVNDAYDHIVVKRGKQMLMWGDRLLDAAVTGYGQWEASANNTHLAVDLIPKDIIICDWHYETNQAKTYPSISIFLEKGFRVFPASYRNKAAVKNLIDYSLQFQGAAMLGHLCSTWSKARPASLKLMEYPPLRIALQNLTIGQSDRHFYGTTPR